VQTLGYHGATKIYVKPHVYNLLYEEAIQTWDRYRYEPVSNYGKPITIMFQTGDIQVFKDEA
jgi:hypothetical protein